MTPYCNYILGDCDKMSNATDCAKVSAQSCRKKREENLKKQEEDNGEVSTGL